DRNLRAPGSAPATSHPGNSLRRLVPLRALGTDLRTRPVGGLDGRFGGRRGTAATGGPAGTGRPGPAAVADEASARAPSALLSVGGRALSSSCRLDAGRRRHAHG